jgi:hypothetical protein
VAAIAGHCTSVDDPWPAYQPVADVAGSGTSVPMAIAEFGQKLTVSGFCA